MKYQIIGIVSLLAVAGSALFTPLGTVQAEDTYIVQWGDTLYELSDRFYGTHKCWPLISGDHRNHSYYPGPLWAESALYLSPQSECDSILHPVELPEAELVSSTTTVVKDSYQRWQHDTTGYRSVDGEIIWFLTESELESYYSYSSFRDNKVKNVQPNDGFEWDFTDTFAESPEGTSSYRALSGDEWYVVVGGVKSAPWDYVDFLIASNLTETVVYRARDTKGRWYLVKNDRATLLDFEPEIIRLNDVLDEPFAINEKFGKPRVYSIFGDWTYGLEDGERIRLVGLGSDGNMIFEHTEWPDLFLKGEEGDIYDGRSSSIQHRNQTYWINDTKLGTSTFRMHAQYSSPGAFSWADDTFGYYGMFLPPLFNEDGNLTIYTVIQNTELTKTIYNVDHLKMFPVLSK